MHNETAAITVEDLQSFGLSSLDPVVVRRALHRVLMERSRFGPESHSDLADDFLDRVMRCEPWRIPAITPSLVAVVIQVLHETYLDHLQEWARANAMRHHAGRPSSVRADLQESLLAVLRTLPFATRAAMNEEIARLSGEFFDTDDTPTGREVDAASAARRKALERRVEKWTATGEGPRTRPSGFSAYPPSKAESERLRAHWREYWRRRLATSTEH